MATQYAFGQIVTNGLVLSLDAADQNSYSGSGTVWNDLSGNNYSGSLTNGPTFDSAANSIVLDGVDDYINSSANSSLSNVATVVMICSGTPSSTNRMYCAFGGYDIYYDGSSDNRRLSFNTGNGDLYGCTGISDTTIAKFTMYTFVFRTDVSYTNNQIWINTTQQSLSQLQGTENPGLRSFSNGSFTIGSWVYGGYYPNLSVASTTIYNRQLSQSEILQNYYQGNIVTDSLTMALDAGNLVSYPGSGTAWTTLTGSISSTLINGPTFSSTNGGAIVFDGVNDLGNCGTVLNFTSEDFSISYWVNFNSLTTNSSGQGPIVIFKGPYFSNGYYDQISTSGVIAFITNQSGTNQATYTNSSVITAGNWYNICYTRSGSSVKIYLNGVQPSQTSGNHINPASSVADFLIASYSNGIFGNLKLSNLMVYNKTLTASEVQQNFNAYRNRFNI